MVISNILKSDIEKTVIFKKQKTSNQEKVSLMSTSLILNFPRDKYINTAHNYSAFQAITRPHHNLL